MLFAKIPDNLAMQELLVNEFSKVIWRITGNDVQRHGHDVAHSLMAMIATVAYRSKLTNDKEILIVCESFKERLAEAIDFMNRRGK